MTFFLNKENRTVKPSSFRMGTGYVENIFGWTIL